MSLTDEKKRDMGPDPKTRFFSGSCRHSLGTTTHLHVGQTSNKTKHYKRNKVDNKPFLNMSKERSENWGLLTGGKWAKAEELVVKKEKKGGRLRSGPRPYCGGS